MTTENAADRVRYEDLDFTPKWDLTPLDEDLRRTMNLEQAMVCFPNGYTACVIRGNGAYGGDEGLNEIAVLDGDGVVYGNPVIDNPSGVEGWQTKTQIEDLIARVRDLPEHPRNSFATTASLRSEILRASDIRDRSADASHRRDMDRWISAMTSLERQILSTQKT